MLFVVFPGKFFRIWVNLLVLTTHGEIPLNLDSW